MPSNYDAIARFYDVDMARNMPFDDVGFYAHQCPHAGRVLELGCGNGRILLPLLAAGFDAVGVDASAGMLAELRRQAAVRGLAAPVAQMDVTRLALRGPFAAILCPYSLLTYITDDDGLARLLGAVRTLLGPGGVFIADAFVPRGLTTEPAFRQDYRRPFGALTLVRSKRITPLSQAMNRIERRYRLEAADGRVVEAIDVTETIRPLAPGDLRARLAAGGFTATQEWWDYGATRDDATAQFYTVAATVTAR